jgi:hypothetical protein
MVPYALSRRRSTYRIAMVFALVMALMAGGCGEASRPGRSPGPQAGRSARVGVEPGSGSPLVKRRGTGPIGPASAGPRHEFAGSLHGRTEARLTVANAASRIRVRAAALPGLLYRITTPAGAGLTPWVTGATGRVRVGLRPNGGAGPDEVTIELNRSVRWDIRLPAGAGEQHLDLVGGRVTRLELGAAGLIDLRLPRPVGTVPVIVTDGAGSVEISTPRATPLRVQLRTGAGHITTPWSAATGAMRLASPGWAGRRDRYAVDVRVGVGALTVR